MFKPVLSRARVEKLAVIYLDVQHRPLGKPLVLSVGTLNTTRTHPRDIFRPAILKSAQSFIMAHNHPSGSLEVSRDDEEFTRQIVRAAEIIGIPVLDHLVVSRHGFVSMKEKGMGGL
jgi:DNA repair protein RadC